MDRQNRLKEGREIHTEIIQREGKKEIDSDVERERETGRGREREEQTEI